MRVVIILTGIVAGWLFAHRKKSTSKLAEFHGRRVHDFLHSYFYFKWTSVYLKPIRYVLERPGIFPQWFYQGAGNRLMHTHHGKVVTNETAKRLIDVKQPIELTNPEQVLPYKKARDIILANAEHLAVIDCPCRQIAENPCQPIDVCFVLGEPFVDFVIEHKKGNAKRLNVTQALEILEREHKRGRVHTAWFKDVAGDRLYSICNCCGCCCLGLKAVSYGFDLVSSSGFTAHIDDAQCMHCGVCAGVCHFGAIEVDESVNINADACRGCGVCVNACPTEAVSLKEDSAKPGPIILPRE
ncbi:MAG TPA: 4Fe-4S dicluster domain-containing protein [Candidatus Aquicultor sp.]|jgi:ferredoxin